MGASCGRGRGGVAHVAATAPSLPPLPGTTTTPPVAQPVPRPPNDAHDEERISQVAHNLVKLVNVLSSAGIVPFAGNIYLSETEKADRSQRVRQKCALFFCVASARATAAFSFSDRRRQQNGGAKRTAHSRWCTPRAQTEWFRIPRPAIYQCSAIYQFFPCKCS